MNVKDEENNKMPSDFNEEAYAIRSEINRLKARLKAIEGDNISKEEEAQLTASNVCGQDFVLAYLQELCKERGSEDIAIMAAWSQKGGWYSTTIAPSCLNYLLRGPQTIKDYFLPLMDKGVLIILGTLLDQGQCDRETLIRISELDQAFVMHQLASLKEKQLIQEDHNRWSLTNQGWHLYIGLGHMAYNYTYKMDIEKLMPIANAFKDIYNIDFGIPILINEADIFKTFKESGHLEKLYNQGVSDDDIRKVIYDSKVILKTNQ